LKAQKDAEDESTRIAFGNMRSEVIDLWHQAIEKDKILLSLIEKLKKSQADLATLSEADQKISRLEEEKKADEKHIADLEYALSAQVELHKSEVIRLEKKLDEVIENFNVEQAKHEIFDMERSRVQKNVEELRQGKEECFSVAMQCSNKLKSTFAKVGAISTDQNFTRGDPEGVIKWIEGEVKAFDEIFTGRGDFL
jgi:DNA mismatch repair ATPase MutS